jgi:DNA-binding SARP family transcriptional activator
LPIQLVTLDELRCSHNGADTDLPRQKRRFALLVYLAMERSAPREKVTALFYPEVDEERARNRLKQSIFALRQEFPGCIETRGDELHAHPDLVLDARDFGSLAEVGEFERALALYQRPFLDGFYLSEAGDWERWVERKRAVLAGIHTRVARAWVGKLIERQEYEAAISHTTRWLELDEHNEDVDSLHMTALAGAGRREEALRHFEALERRLREEDTRKPSLAVLQVADSIRRNMSTVVPVVPDVEPRPVDPDPVPPRTLLRYALVALAIVSLIGTLVWGFRSTDSPLREFFYSDQNVDTTRYAIFPLSHAAGATADLNEATLMYEALAYWRGIGIADQLQVGEALSRRGNRPLRWREARAIARELGAGRFFLVRVSGVGADTRVHVGLYSAARYGSEIRSTSRRLRTPADVDTAYTSIVDDLLFGRETVFAREPGRGTRSVPAQRAFSRGLAAVQNWNLSAADTAFLQAFEHDGDFARAALWLALVRSWITKDASQWAFAADRAAVNLTQLLTRDRMLVEALRATSRGNIDIACGLYRRLTELEDGFVPWYSLANCLANDDLVVRSTQSPSGFLFRSSSHSSTGAFIRAFRHLPSAHRGLSNDLFIRLRRLLFTSDYYFRSGQDARGALYAALPGWSEAGDTLVLIPHPYDNVIRAEPHTLPPNTQLALFRQRQTFLHIARGWVARYPESSQAQLALAFGLDLTGDAAAVSTMESALLAAAGTDDIELLRAVAVGMGFKHGLPADLPMLRRAVLRADSLLQSTSPGRAQHPRVLAAVAALRGQVHLAAEYHQQDLAQSSVIPTQIQRTGQRLVLYSAFGTDEDSVRLLTNLLLGQSESLLSAPARVEARENWLVRSAILSFDRLPGVPPPHEIESAYYLRNAQLLFARGDTAGAIAKLDSVSMDRRGSGPVSMDALLPEAVLRQAAGDTAGAIALLDEGLLGLRQAALEDLQDPVIAAAIGAAIKLRLDLAIRRADLETAHRWSEALLTIWSNGTALSGEERRILRRLQRGSSTRR